MSCSYAISAQIIPKVQSNSPNSFTHVLQMEVCIILATATYMQVEVDWVMNHNVNQTTNFNGSVYTHILHTHTTHNKH